MSWKIRFGLEFVVTFDPLIVLNLFLLFSVKSVSHNSKHLIKVNKFDH